jgi:ABC-2 type transport system ATP-binding protein
MSLLRVERLSKTFGTIRAVDSVSFEVRPGEIYGLLGPNGAGKTTSISMISGLLKPDAGEVFVGGKPFWSDPQAAKRIMGVVPQELAIYEELTGRENLEFWGRMAGLSSGEARIARGRIARSAHADGSREGRGEDLFRRHEAAHQSRLRAAASPQTSAARRADGGH